MPIRHAEPIGDRETQRAAMELMLRSLPAQHREIIVATYFRGRTTREAARLLGLAPDAAKARLYQAMRDLSDMLAADWPGEIRARGHREVVLDQDRWRAAGRRPS